MLQKKKLVEIKLPDIPRNTASVEMPNKKDILKNKKSSDSNGIRTHNHLVRNGTLKHIAKLASLAKWLSVCLQTKWLWVRILLLSLKLQI